METIFETFKRVLKRTVNVFSVGTVVGWLWYVWEYVVIIDDTIGRRLFNLLESVGFTIGGFIGLGVFNYIVLGKITIWWKKEDTHKELE